MQATGSATTVTSLWPFSDGYTMWAGQCNQADPAASGGSRSPAVVMAAGSTNSATVQLDRRGPHGAQRSRPAGDERDGHRDPPEHHRVREHESRHGVGKPRQQRDVAPERQSLVADLRGRGEDDVADPLRRN